MAKDSSFARGQSVGRLIIFSVGQFTTTFTGTSADNWTVLLIPGCQTESAISERITLSRWFKKCLHLTSAKLHFAFVTLFAKRQKTRQNQNVA